MVHVREVDGKPLRFGHSGWLWFNAYLLYDEHTSSLWHHYTGTAMAGPLRGSRMRSLPTTLPTFAAWRAEHPRTLVLRKPDPAPDVPDTSTDSYASRNATVHWGYGFDAGDGPRWVRFEAIPETGLLETDTDGRALAIVRDPGGRSAHVWDRRVGEAVLSLDVDTAGAGGDARPVLRERGGQRAWWLRTGQPLPGTPSAPPLTAVPGSLWEEAAWSLQHPGGRVIPERPPASPSGR